MVGALAHTDHQSNERRNRPLRKPRQGRRPKILNPPTNPEPARVFAITPRSADRLMRRSTSRIVPPAAARTSFTSRSTTPATCASGRKGVGCRRHPTMIRIGNPDVPDYAVFHKSGSEPESRSELRSYSEILNVPFVFHPL